MNSSVQASATASNPTLYWDGEKYHHNSNQQKFVADMLLGQYAFKATDHVLDVGCGDGKITKEIARQLDQGRAVGADPSESMIHFANAKFAGGNLSFHCAKASELTFFREFDVITSFSSLHWEPKQKEALLCFRQALKPGGAILLAIPGPDLILRRVLNKLCQSERWASFFNGYQSPGRIWTVNEYARLLLDTEFAIQKIEWVDRPYLLQEEEYRGLLNAMLPHLSRLPIDERQDFTSRIVNEIKMTERADPFGQLTFEVKVIEVLAHSPIN